VNLLIPPPAIDPLYAFLPLALAGMVTFVLLSGQCLAQLFAEQDHSFM
jgi:hypothetical protein